MIKILFLIRSLNYGGAERQLIELVKGLDKKRFSITILTFYNVGELQKGIKEEKDITLLSLYKKGRWDVFPFIWRLLKILYKIKPDVIHGYMGVANELSLIGKIFNAKVIWGLRCSSIDFSNYDNTTKLLDYKLGKWLSGIADLIIVNSKAGKDHYIKNGYNQKRLIIITNGIDTELFRPDNEARQRLRTEWNINKNEILIGLIARIDPLKDHRSFLQAASLLLKKRTDIKFICVGNGPQLYKNELKEMSENLGLKERLIWAGERKDICAIYNALDILTLCSISEGFPNVIGEAMACGVPCVVTNVGDSAVIVGETGIVVSPHNIESLLNGFDKCLLKLNDQNIHKITRQKIIQEFSSTQLVSSTENAIYNLMRI
ncbi:glycosyltransferase [Candidatus Poribacteria bacterium]|nr:glycosyltransferase [Candidatus Poribacteria bacterium]